MYTVTYGLSDQIEIMNSTSKVRCLLPQPIHVRHFVIGIWLRMNTLVFWDAMPLSPVEFTDVSIESLASIISAFGGGTLFV